MKKIILIITFFIAGILGFALVSSAELGVMCQNHPGPDFCPGGINDTIAVGKDDKGCTIWGCLSKQNGSSAILTEDNAYNHIFCQNITPINTSLNSSPILLCNSPLNTITAPTGNLNNEENADYQNWLGSSAASQCSDGIDNDLDGKIDYPTDDGCLSLSDNDENKLIRYADGCLTQGDKLKNIFGEVIFLCGHDLCHICVGLYETGNYTASPYHCYGLPACGFSTGTNETQQTDLSFNLINPVQGIFDTTSIMVEFNSNKNVEVFMHDTFGDTRTRVCSGCYSYARKRSFKDGTHNLTFTANYGTQMSIKTTSFLVDSKKPKIKKTLPKKGFASGLFEIEFQEANPSSLILNYGNNAVGLRRNEINLNNCEAIKGSSEKKACSVQVGLEDYDSQAIEYWFYLEDIANSAVESKHLLLQVDTTFPEAIDNTNYNMIGKYIYFNISVEEENFDEVFYSYIDSRGSLREKTLCSSLKNGICLKKVSFAPGHQDLTINVIDEAGNLIGWPVSFGVA